MNATVYINPILEATGKVFKEVCGYSTRLKGLTGERIKLSNDKMFIMLGVTGSTTGQVVFVLSLVEAKRIASAMMGGIPVLSMDDIAKSAVGELGNMIMGNAATTLFEKGVEVDITPPALGFGETEILTPGTISIKASVTYDLGSFDLYFLLQCK